LNYTGNILRQTTLRDDIVYGPEKTLFLGTD
jgi:hypothetical protein